MDGTPPPERARRPHPAAGVVAFVAVAAGMVATSRLSLEVALLVSPALVLFVTGAATALFGAEPKRTLLLRLPATSDLVMAVPLAFSFVILSDQLGALSQEYAPLPPEVFEILRTILRATTPMEWIVKLAIVGVAAAVSEELLFRGFILSAFRQGRRPTLAVVFSALLFMSLHPQFVPTFAAGLVLGFVAVATESIVVPIVVHLVNNVAVLLLFNVAELETLGDPLWIPEEILLPAVAIFVIAFAYYARHLVPTGAEQDEPSASPERTGSAAASPLLLLREPGSLSGELAGVAANRRRLGWAVVASAVVGGALVLLALFSTSVYYIYPQRVHGLLIDTLKRQSEMTLAPDAADKLEEVGSAFDALGALNDNGQLEWSDLVRLTEEYNVIGADGVLDRREADDLVATIRSLVLDKTTARPL